jgi:hypothetical protein
MRIATPTGWLRIYIFRFDNILKVVKSFASILCDDHLRREFQFPADELKAHEQ